MPEPPASNERRDALAYEQFRNGLEGRLDDAFADAMLALLNRLEADAQAPATAARRDAMRTTCTDALDRLSEGVDGGQVDAAHYPAIARHLSRIFTGEVNAFAHPMPLPTDSASLPAARPGAYTIAHREGDDPLVWVRSYPRDGGSTASRSSRQ
ncbi:MAG TPA: hypothetical protein VIM12_03690 [Noviherbaspirillum sp.]|uniref:hypothetical protein n=1 Tax=Noviherbaspirillum sp. TaxID=1926288 RepID=UPI002F92A3DC